MGPIDIEDLKKQMANVKKNSAAGYFTNQLKSKPPLYTQQSKTKLLYMSQESLKGISALSKDKPLNEPYSSMKREFKIQDEGDITPLSNNNDEIRLQSALLQVRNNTGMSTLEGNEQRRSRKNDLIE